MGRRSFRKKTSSANDAAESIFVSGTTDVPDPTEPELPEEPQEQSAKESVDQDQDAEVANTHDAEEVVQKEEVDEKPTSKRRGSTRVSELSKKQSGQVVTSKRPRTEKSTGGKLKFPKTLSKKVVKTPISTPKKMNKTLARVSSANTEKIPEKSLGSKPKNMDGVGKEGMNKSKKRRIRYRKPTAPKDLIVARNVKKNPLFPQLKTLLGGARGFVTGKRGGFIIRHMPKESFTQMINRLARSPFELKTATLHTPEGLYSVTLILENKSITTKTGIKCAADVDKQKKSDSSMKRPKSAESERSRSENPARCRTPAKSETPSKSPLSQAGFSSPGKKRTTMKQRSRSMTRRSSSSKPTKRK